VATILAAQGSFVATVAPDHEAVTGLTHRAGSGTSNVVGYC
jgi:hypothetical protein